MYYTLITAVSKEFIRGLFLTELEEILLRNIQDNNHKQKFNEIRSLLLPYKFNGYEFGVLWNRMGSLAK